VKSRSADVSPANVTVPPENDASVLSSAVRWSPPGARVQSSALVDRTSPDAMPSVKPTVAPPTVVGVADGGSSSSHAASASVSAISRGAMRRMRRA